MWRRRKRKKEARRTLALKPYCGWPRISCGTIWTRLSILDFNEYSFFLDFKKNRRRDRLHVLRDCLDSSNLSSSVRSVQATESSQSVLIQMVDVLTGCASRRINATSQGSTAKDKVLQVIESRLGKKIAPTSRSENKFNIFRINLSGGW